MPTDDLALALASQNACSSARRGCPRLAAVFLLAAAACIALPGCGQPKTQPLDGKFSVLVRPPDRTIEPVPVEDSGALPVQTGGAMCLEVQLNEPAFAYLIWLDCSGQALPLYPWNNESLENKDIHQAPPTRRASNRIFSPQLGNSWAFGDCQGMETVLLLARRTPLPAGRNIGDLLGAPPPPPPVRLPNELFVLSVNGGSQTVATLLAQNRGAEAESQAADERLQQLLLKLAKDFDLVRAVRFAHAGP